MMLWNHQSRFLKGLFVLGVGNLRSKQHAITEESRLLIPWQLNNEETYTVGCSKNEE